MDPLPPDPWLNGLSIVVVLGSVTAWVWIIWKWRTSGYVLQFEPRRRAPWGAGAALPALVFVLLAVMQAFAPAAAEQDEHIRNGQAIASRIAAMLLLQLFFSGGLFVVVALIYRAMAQDFGLPRFGREALRDVAIGIVACFAAFIPVGAAQEFLQRLMGREDGLSQHQLIQMITGAGAIDAWVMLLACLSAVIVAPICEEIAFRLLFQGWLEKREDEVVRNDPDGGPDQWTIQAWNSRLEDTTNPLLMNGPGRRGLAGLPYGWMPILASSVLFGLAHAGYGPEPVPLFLFALLLGYVYQRTNRILPCIMAHGLFNAVTMLALWRMILQGAD